MSEATGSYRFLSGAEMDPESILEALPEARFVARARLSADESGAADEIWGIVVRVVDAGDPTTERAVTTDDGRVLMAAVAGDGRPVGEPAAVLAAAKYWELPPSYVQRLPGNR